MGRGLEREGTISVMTACLHVTFVGMHEANASTGLMDFPRVSCEKGNLLRNRFSKRP